MCDCSTRDNSTVKDSKELVARAAINGVTVVRDRYGRSDHYAVGQNDVAVFTDAEAFGKWCAEWFKERVKP